MLHTCEPVAAERVRKSLLTSESLTNETAVKLLGVLFTSPVSFFWDLREPFTNFAMHDVSGFADFPIAYTTQERISDTVVQRIWPSRSARDIHSVWDSTEQICNAVVSHQEYRDPDVLAKTLSMRSGHISFLSHCLRAILAERIEQLPLRAEEDNLAT